MKTEVKSDNELIAEFMGGVFYGPDDLDHPNKWWFKEQPHEGYRKDAHHLTVGLRYNIDWSWLMPVVEKIEHDGHEIDIYKNACEIDMEEGMIREVAGGKIEATYKAVVEFIRWYNSQTTSNP